ncbi:MAG TPA: ArsC family reductase [Halothiobacillus sp.]|nr:ArsC family reductase [Halothiobacillus sp.]
MRVVYGIPQCDKVRKARKWLDEQQLAYQFHDYKQSGVDVALLKSWIDRFGWEQVINRRGTNWRRLPEAQRQAMGAEAALLAAIDNPSLIKRPILMDGELCLLGFDIDAWQDALL